MQRDFIILYQGREGSSPIIDSLARHSAIYVPVFEDLDERKYSRGDGHDESSLSRVFRALFSRTEAEFLASEIPEFSYSSFTSAKSIGFKWRLWGDPAELSAVFRQQGITVFVLLRRREIDRCLSQYFTNEILDGQLGFEKDSAGNVHPQFRLARLSEAAYEAYLEEMGRLRFTIGPERVAAMLRTSVVRKRKFLSLLREYVGSQARMEIIYYEDFTASRCEFFENFLSAISIPFEDSVLDSTFRKSSPDFKEVVENYDEIMKDASVGDAIREWAALLDEFEGFATVGRQ